MIATFWSYVETCAGILRKRNRGEIGVAAFQSALTALQGEVLSSPDFQLLTVENSDILGGLQYLYSHSLNTADAALLATYLRYVRLQPPTAPWSVLVASDHRLGQTARSEGLTTLDPEQVAAVDIPALLATL
jgi:hypothetical protein